MSKLIKGFYYAERTDSKNLLNDVFVYLKIVSIKRYPSHLDTVDIKRFPRWKYPEIINVVIKKGSDDVEYITVDGVMINLNNKISPKDFSINDFSVCYNAYLEDCKNNYPVFEKGMFYCKLDRKNVGKFVYFECLNVTDEELMVFEYTDPRHGKTETLRLNQGKRTTYVTTNGVNLHPSDKTVYSYNYVSDLLKDYLADGE